ncbi:MAG: MFS transporter [Candidatus Bathyarchaeota archaeon]|nr:MFS transporter [Candidatus Bathyarchaeota archaeon]
MNVPIVKYRWVILVLAYLCMLGFAFTFQSLPPVLTLVAEDLALTHAESGLLMSLFSLPTIFLAILAGLLSDRFGPFKIGLISIGIMILGTSIFAASSDFAYAGLGRVIAGMGAATVSIMAAQLVALWFRGTELGTAMGIFSTAMPVATIISFTTFGELGKVFGWQIPILVPAILGAIAFVAFMLLHKPVQTPSEEANFVKEGLFSNLLKTANLAWVVGFCWMWFNAAVISFSTFAPDFFGSKGYNIAFAGFLTSLLMWGSLIMSPIIGRLLDKFDNNDLFIAAGGIILASAIYLVAISDNYLFSMLAMAVAAGLVPTSVFSFQSKISRTKNFGVGFGILTALSSVGTFFGPYAAGFIRDETGSYEMSFIFLSIVAMLVTVTAIALRVQKRRGS